MDTSRNIAKHAPSRVREGNTYSQRDTLRPEGDERSFAADMLASGATVRILSDVSGPGTIQSEKDTPEET